MDTSQDSSESPTIVLALQRLFYRLQFENAAVDTKELTKSFGWDSGYTGVVSGSNFYREVFTQHDAQELSRLFIDTLEMKMKGTSLDGKNCAVRFSHFHRPCRENVPRYRIERYRVP